MESHEDWQRLFYTSIINTDLQRHLADFAQVINDWQSATSKEKTRLAKQIKQLPEINKPFLEITDVVSLRGTDELIESQRKKTISVLKQFMPWRKGPYNFCGIEIDTEWRSNWKWDRVESHIDDLHGQRVLDVGCGSGYHLFRMHQQGACQVIGIDPTDLFMFQFQCFKKYFPKLNIHFLPIGIEKMPATGYFDCVFSMGVLYHRSDPIKFLKELKDQLVSSGQLVLETLVIEGDETRVLVPEKRYANMRNVWFIPSVDGIILWLKKLGFKDVKCVDLAYTTTDEQRATPWMQNQTLQDFLDATDHTKTIEGYQAPLRAVILARN